MATEGEEELVFGFNPRSHVGSDAHAWQLGYKCLVSIHAPTWGATKYD